jgi:hypothetical protein
MAGSYVSQLASGKLTPQEFVAKSAAWFQTQRFIPRGSLGWLIDALERLLIAKGVPSFVAEVLTNELKEALGLRDEPAAPPVPPAPS